MHESWKTQWWYPAVDIETWEWIVEKLEKLPEQKPRVLEVTWDGDTTGWYVVMILIYEDEPSQFRETEIVALQGTGGDFRLFTGQVPPWPEAFAAFEIGNQIARMLEIPLFFLSPHRPEDTDVPRWKDWIQGRVWARPIYTINVENVVNRLKGEDVVVVEAYWSFHYEPMIHMSVFTSTGKKEPEESYKQHHIGRLYWHWTEIGKTFYGIDVPKHKPIVEAKRIGEALSEAFSVPFYFSSPDQPDVKAPRWRDTLKK